LIFLEAALPECKQNVLRSGATHFDHLCPVVLHFFILFEPIANFPENFPARAFLGSVMRECANSGPDEPSLIRLFLNMRVDAKSLAGWYQ
jgi:hypothetical protein